jgi:hypothetical protein
VKCVLVFASAASLIGLAIAAYAQDGNPIEAMTPTGEKVLLHPNGRWEYVDRVKQQAAKKVADTYPENQARPPGAQGGLFGFGRTIPPGDPDYNRGSLSGKGR